MIEHEGFHRPIVSRSPDCGREVGEANLHDAVFVRSDLAAHANGLIGATINNGEIKPIGGRSDCLQDWIKMFPSMLCG